jgi:hypothetical protein
VRPTAWYAGYGSNLSRARLCTYLQGGRPPGARRPHPGARDPRPPAEVTTCTLPGRIAFRGSFTGWGDGGGAAFWEGPAGPGRAWCRAYLLRTSQVTDLALQENGVSPDDLGADELARLDRRVADHATSDTHPRCGLVPSSRPYADLVRATATTSDGHRMEVLTVTFPEGGTPPPPTPPPVAYLRVILGALEREVGLDTPAAHAYLREAGAAPVLLERAREGGGAR